MLSKGAATSFTRHEPNRIAKLVEDCQEPSVQRKLIVPSENVYFL
jgi:hypothetical protein